MTCVEPKIPNISKSGKFFSQLGHKFFLKAMRVEVVTELEDFDRKLTLRKRFDELKRAHTTGVILPESQAEPMLGLAAQAGLQALVELEARPEYLLDRKQFGAMMARTIPTVSMLRSNSASPTVDGRCFRPTRRSLSARRISRISLPRRRLSRSIP